MNSYLLLKWLHVLSSVLLVGTGFGSAFYFFFAQRSGSLAVQAAVNRLVVRADWWFTTPTVLLQPATGLLMAQQAGWDWWQTPWLRWSLALYLLAGACWLPVVWLQIQMARLASEALARDQPLPPRYGVYLRCWTLLGFPAFAAMLVIYYLMLAKPAL
ncbi:DUF2269 domain-containing protein [Paucibacter sp. APW11]|uniref:DUF2269 domain-containing protein n=1 Tax=Roseateles aquae TaxID=3077235 RepID=A0ABU3PE02_9BURK|nr:DUF2269 domain-containing protein [Paucibacter sp. APW11]MDT9000827.1 DUF2269 domain-containing protein [Paucibacter sp. APW11]